MKNQVLNDEYIVKKITWFNHKYNHCVDYLGINELDAEALYRYYESRGNMDVRRNYEIYSANIYYDPTIPIGTCRVSASS